jgi:glycine/D-amino acid oxidase-like deaminating enzyme
LAARGVAAWDRFFAESGEDLVRRCGLIWLAADAMHVQDRHLRAPLVELAELTDRVPSVTVRVPAGTSIFEDRGAYSPVAGVTAAMRTRLSRLGCHFYEHTDVQSIDVSPHHVDVLARDVRIRANAAVVALGPWAPASPLLRDMTAEHGRLRVKKVVALHIDVSPTARCAGLVLLDDYSFLIPMKDEAYWLFSFTSQHWDVRPEPLLQVNADDLAIATPILDRWAPELAKRVSSSRVFCDCYAADPQPRIERHRESDRVVYIVAGAGNGFRFAPPCAEDAIDLLGLRPTVELPS